MGMHLHLIDWKTIHSCCGRTTCFCCGRTTKTSAWICCCCFFVLLKQLMSTHTDKARGMHLGLCRCPASSCDPNPDYPARRMKYSNERSTNWVPDTYATYINICCGLAVFIAGSWTMNWPQTRTCEVTDPDVNQKIETHGEVHRPSNHNANTVWLGVVCKDPTVLSNFVCGGVHVECILLPTPRIS